MEYIKETAETSSAKKKNEGGINLKDVVGLIIGNWHWILLSTIIFLVGARMYYATLTPTYKSQMVMLFKTNENKPKSRNDVMGDIVVTGGLSGSGVSNELYLLKTNQLMRGVVERLHLDVSYSLKGVFRDHPVYNTSCPIEVIFTSEFTKPVSCEIKIKSADKYQIISVNGQDVNPQTFTFGQKVTCNAGSMIVTAKPTTAHSTGSTVIVNRLGLFNAAARYQGQIASELVSEETQLIRLSSTDPIPERSDSILHALFDEYSKSIIEDKNRVAVNTERFIDQRVGIIGQELADVESDLADFKKRNNIFDVTSGSTQYMSQSSAAEKKAVEIETEISIAKAVRDYLNDVSKREDLIPAVGCLSDIAIQFIAHVAEAVFLAVFKLSLVTVTASAASVARRVHVALAMRLSGLVHLSLIARAVFKSDVF